MNKKCRIILTTMCNYECSYCCNKLPEVQSRFKMSTLSQIIEMGYEEYNLTGGEIGLVPYLLEEVVSEIPDSKKIWLYSNGLLGFALTNTQLYNFKDRISGVNLGYHSHVPVRRFWEDVDKIRGEGLKGRIQVEDVEKVRFMSETLSMYFPEIFDDVEIKYWKRDECNKTDEDWFII